jgi:hypothetical protein
MLGVDRKEMRIGQMAGCGRPESLYDARHRTSFSTQIASFYIGAKSVVALKRAAQPGTVGVYAVQHCAASFAMPVPMPQFVQTRISDQFICQPPRVGRIPQGSF